MNFFAIIYELLYINLVNDVMIGTKVGEYSFIRSIRVRLWKINVLIVDDRDRASVY